MQSSPPTADQLREDIVEMLKTCYDPEIPVDIYELGLIYKIDVSPERHAKVTMTLTTPMCPVAETLPQEVQDKVNSVPGVEAAEIDLVWEPPWEPAMMSEGARLQLGF